MTLELHNSERMCAAGAVHASMGYAGERAQDVARAIHTIFPEIYAQSVGLSAPLPFAVSGFQQGDVGMQANVGIATDPGQGRTV